MKVRTRFAPSPTGELHPGNVRIAVLNWLFARHHEGRFILRIEDTDVDRNVAGAEEEILDSLRRLGLDWDEGPDVGGAYGPYRQSERSELYREYAERLVATAAAFRCYCRPDELEARKRAALAEGENPRYDGTCRTLSPDDRQLREKEGIQPSIRFLVEREEVTIHDVVRGEISFDAGEFGDFVIIKSNGTPTYNFGVVVDDHSMEITHVIRGAGHLMNTPRQLMIYRAIGAEPPIFVHVPHVLAPDGSPLSKRHGARSLREYLDEGFHPQAIINYLSLLSWSSASGEEVLPPERLIEEIDLGRLGASDARLDPEKLEWLSGEYIRAMPPRELAEKLTPCLVGDYADLAAECIALATAVQPRINTFSQVQKLLPQFRPPDPMRWSDEALEVLRGEGTAALLKAVRTEFEAGADWNGESAMDAVRAAGRKTGLKGKRLFMPVRAALSGATKGPDLQAILALQGRDTSRRVIEQTLNELGKTR